jgi:hypothetical protein
MKCIGKGSWPPSGYPKKAQAIAEELGSIDPNSQSMWRDTQRR